MIIGTAKGPSTLPGVLLTAVVLPVKAPISAYATFPDRPLKPGPMFNPERSLPMIKLSCRHGQLMMTPVAFSRTVMFDGQNYIIEIQLTTQQSHISLASGQTQLVVYLLVSDVDLDNDLDLVLVSYTSLFPEAVWLNDGKANFSEGSGELWLNLLIKDIPLSVDPHRFPASAVSITESYRLPLDQLVDVFLSQKLQPHSWVAGGHSARQLSSRPYHLTPRGPPLYYS